MNALIGQIQAREGQRVSGREVAQFLAIRPSTLSKWLNGGTRLDQIEWLLRLIERLGEEERWVKEIREACTKAASARRSETSKPQARGRSTRGKEHARPSKKARKRTG